MHFLFAVFAQAFVFSLRFINFTAKRTSQNAGAKAAKIRVYRSVGTFGG
jgi:hypothetical protein